MVLRFDCIIYKQDGSTGELLASNMFAYCRNNLVMHADSDGGWALGAIFLAADVTNFIKHP